MKNIQGFSLIEVMIAVGTIAVLAAIALPMYSQHQIRVNRTDVQAEMLDIASKLSQQKIIRHNYKGVTLTSINKGAQFPSDRSPNYDLVLDIDTDNQGYTLSATPLSNTKQKDDGIICLNQDGQRFWQKGKSTCKLSATSTWN